MGFEAILLPGRLLCTANWHSRLRGREEQWQEGGPGPRGTVAGMGEGNRDGHSHTHSLGKPAKQVALRQSERMTPKSHVGRRRGATGTSSIDLMGQGSPHGGAGADPTEEGLAAGCTHFCHYPFLTISGSWKVKKQVSTGLRVKGSLSCSQRPLPLGTLALATPTPTSHSTLSLRKMTVS